MRYLLLILFFTIQTFGFGANTHNLQKSNVKKALASKKSDVEVRSELTFAFQGQYYDADIELAYNRFRYFDQNDGRYISQDPIGFASGEFGFYNYVDDTNTWTDVLGLSKSSYNGKRGTAKAKHDLERNGFTIVKEEVTMKVNGSRVRADIVDRDNKGNLHVFEVKHGKGRLTKNQKKAGVYDLNSQSNTTTNLGGGKITPSKGTKGTFDIATNSDRGKPFGGNGATNDATFHTLVYN